MKLFYPLKAASPLFLFLALSLFFTAIEARAQKDCGFDKQHQLLLKKDAAYKTAIAAMRDQVKSFIVNRQFHKTEAQVYKIPVVVHVIHLGEPVGTGTNISDAQIQSAITSLTQYYRGLLGSSPD